MKKFVIERTFPGASELTSEELREISQTSNEVAASLGVPYVWHETYVAGDKMYCVHEADTPEEVYEHARRAGFPIDSVTEVADVIGPETAREPAPAR